MNESDLAHGPLDPSELAAWRDALPASIHFGTSSWTYPGWEGLVYHRPYPARGAAAALLDEYTRFPLFTTVGIDSTFYRPPSAQTFASYAKHLPPGFPCVSKVWDRITVHTWSGKRGHEPKGEANSDFLSVDRFLEEVHGPAMAHFRDHQAVFVFEFQQIAADDMTPERFAGQLDHFFTHIPHDVAYAVEVRNPEFLHPAYFAVLREHGVAHLFNSWTRMPAIGAQLDLADVITAGFVIARALLRPGRTYNEAVDAFAPYDTIREPQPALRRDLVRLARTARDLRIPAWILVNNRAEGSAPRTIAAVARTLAEEGSVSR